MRGDPTGRKIAGYEVEAELGSADTGFLFASDG